MIKLSERTIKGDRIKLFNRMQIWYHKHIIHFMIFFIITGLPIISHKFSFIAYGIGVPISSMFNGADPLYVGIEACRIIHRITAILWILTTIPFVISMMFTKWDLVLNKRKDESLVTCLKEETQDLLDSYVFFKYPKRNGKYNIGQLAAGILAIGLSIAILVSGIFLWMRSSFSPEFISFMKIIHDLAFYGFLVFLTIHVYLALFPTNRSGYNAMFTDGFDDIEHAKKKHPGMFKE